MVQRHKMILLNSTLGLVSRNLGTLCNKNMVRSIKLKVHRNFECVSRALGKIIAGQFNNYSQINSRGVLELVHTALCGPLE